MARRRSILSALRNAVDPTRTDPVPENPVVPVERSMELPAPNLDRLTGQGITSNPRQPLLENPDVLREVSSRLLESDTSRRSVLNAIRAAPMVPRIARSLQVPHVARGTISPEDLIKLIQNADYRDLPDAIKRIEDTIRLYSDPALSKFDQDTSNKIIQHNLPLRDLAVRANELGYDPDFRYLSNAREALAQPDLARFNPELSDVDLGRIEIDFRELSKAHPHEPTMYDYAIDPNLLNRIETALSRLPSDPDLANRYVSDTLARPEGTRMSHPELNRTLRDMLRDEFEVDLTSRDDLVRRIKEAAMDSQVWGEDVLSEMRNLRPSPWPDEYIHGFDLGEPFSNTWYYGFINPVD
jgi:hypothetical protein